jgi:hypothetical protein
MIAFYNLIVNIAFFGSPHFNSFACGEKQQQPSQTASQIMATDWLTSLLDFLAFSKWKTTSLTTDDTKLHVSISGFFSPSNNFAGAHLYLEIFLYSFGRRVGELHKHQRFILAGTCM